MKSDLDLTVESQEAEKIENKALKPKTVKKKSEPTTSLNILPKFHKFLYSGDKKDDK